MRFTKIPVTIDAMQWSGTAEDAHAVIQWIHNNGGNASYDCKVSAHMGCSGKDEDHTIAIDTLEGRSLDAGPGWWVIKGVEGEFYPCAPSVFEATYRPAEEEE